MKKHHGTWKTLARCAASATVLAGLVGGGALAQAVGLAVNDRVMQNSLKGTILRIGGAGDPAYLRGCYGVHFDYARYDPTVVQWFCQNLPSNGLTKLGPDDQPVVPAQPPQAQPVAEQPAPPYAPPPPPTPPPQPAPAVTRYCGTFHNQTYNITTTGEVDVSPGAFSGKVIVGTQLYGSGTFTGTVSGGQCELNVQSPQWHMSGPCSATSMSGDYQISGQVGVYSMTAGACPQQPGAHPAPYAPPPPPPPYAPQPPPQPAPAVTRYCGTFQNQTYNITTTGEVDVSPGAFSGKVIVGTQLYGSGPFTGTVSGGQCELNVQSPQWHMSGPCSAMSMSGNYQISGQVGVYSMTTAACR